MEPKYKVEYALKHLQSFLRKYEKIECLFSPLLEIPLILFEIPTKEPLA